MKKSKINLIFILICLIALLTPLAGMSFAKTTSTTEKRQLAEFPALVNENGLNVAFLSGLGEYFEDHFAFKNQLVAADSIIQSKAFKTSSVDTVVVGKSNWLYYTDSVNDYLGKNVLTDRQAYDAAHNIMLMQKRLKQDGVDFYLTIAPNKNSLYGENMPYYLSKRVSTANNYSKIQKEINELGVNYIDLYPAFKSQNETLYLRQDSHWNEKGAVLAYNTILDAMKVNHNDLSETEQIRTKTKIGDLSTALYSVAGEAEWDSKYQYNCGYTITNDAPNFESELVETKNDNANQSLLMFRDSFGNTLSPLIAESYNSACFSKNTVYFLDSYLNKYNPNTVLVEIVERNLDRFVMFSLDSQQSSGPPIMLAPSVDIDTGSAQSIETGTEIVITDSDLQPDYQLIYGELDFELEANTNVYVQIGQGTYEAFLVSNENGDEGYLLYTTPLDKNEKITVFAESNGITKIIAQK